MYKRKIESLLQEWKDQPKRKPLIIKGVRQCGKTSSVLAIAISDGVQPLYLNDIGIGTSSVGGDVTLEYKVTLK